MSGCNAENVATIAKKITEIIREHGVNGPDSGYDDSFAAKWALRHAAREFDGRPGMQDWFLRSDGTSQQTNPLILSIQANIPEIFDALIVQREVNVNFMDHEGHTPLYRAVRALNVDACRKLLEKGARPADRDCLLTEIMNLQYANNPRIVANPSDMLRSTENALQIAELLVRHGAVDPHADIYNDKGILLDTIFLSIPSIKEAALHLERRGVKDAVASILGAPAVK